MQAPIGGFYTAESTVPFLGMLLLLYSIGRYAPGRRFYAAFGITVAGILGALATETGWEGIDDLVWASFLFTLPALAGRALRSRSQLQAQLREKAERAEVERRVKAEAAVEEERARIASELQALVANGVSAMVVQAETVPRALAAGETARRASRSPPSRTPAATRSPRCGGCSECCGATATGPSSPHSRASAASPP